MKNFNRIFNALVFFTLVYFTSISSFANEPIYFSGIITDVQGQRMAIQLDGGSQIWGSMEQTIPANPVGQKISGRFISLGETYVLINPVISNGE